MQNNLSQPSLGQPSKFLIWIVRGKWGCGFDEAEWSRKAEWSWGVSAFQCFSAIRRFGAIRRFSALGVSAFQPLIPHARQCHVMLRYAVWCRHAMLCDDDSDDGFPSGVIRWTWNDTENVSTTPAQGWHAQIDKWWWWWWCYVMLSYLTPRFTTAHASISRSIGSGWIQQVI